MSDTLPAGWIRTSIAEVTTGVEQRRPAPQEQFDYIDIASIDRNTKQVTAPQRLSGANAPSRARQVVAAGDVLVSMTRPNLNAVALVTPNLDRQIASTGFDVLRPIDIDPRWLFYIVRSDGFVRSMSELVQGALYPAVRPRDVRNFEIPLASLNEQQRIADKLDAVLARVDACLERLDRAPLVLKRFRQAILAAATSGRLTEEWREANDKETSDWSGTTVGEIAQVFLGRQRSPKHHYGAHMRRYVRAANVTWNGWDLSDVKEMNFDPRDFERYRLQVGDILLNEGSGSADEVGKPAIWNGEIEDCCFQNTLICVRPYETSSKYLYFLLLHAAQSRAFVKDTRGVNIFHIGKERLSGFEITLPPPDEQHEIVDRVEALFAHADRLEARYQAARGHVERLTPSLLAKAFRGELVPQDPDDEPASVLLERVRAAREAQPAKPKRAPIPRKQEMTTMTIDSVRDAICQLTADSFSFDELRKGFPGDYDLLKDIVFALLDESDPSITQVFDQDAREMRFVRRRT